MTWALKVCCLGVFGALATFLLVLIGVRFVVSRKKSSVEVVDGFSSAVDRVNHDDGPLNKDSVLLSPGEIAVFDESGKLLVWFPSPDAGPPYEMVCENSVTVLTYDDMPQATPRMRDQLRLLKGGKYCGR